MTKHVEVRGTGDMPKCAHFLTLIIPGALHVLHMVSLILCRVLWDDVERRNRGFDL